MSYKLVIYKMIKKVKPPASPFNFYSSLMLLDGLGFTNFIIHCRDLVSSIVREGSTVPVTNLILRRRMSLGLPPLKFDKVDVKELAVVTGLLKILERFE